MTEILKHHELTAEWIDDEHGPAVMLIQADPLSDDQPTVLVHPWQLRAVCEQFDLMPASDPQAAKTIAMLTRRLLLLRDRIEFLANYLANHSDSKHADLSFEQTYATATADIADEFCAELRSPLCELDADTERTPCKPDASTVQASLI